MRCGFARYSGNSEAVAPHSWRIAAVLRYSYRLFPAVLAAVLAIKDLSHLSKKSVAREGFLEIVDTRRHHAVPDNRVIRIARHEQDPGILAQRCELLTQFATAHLRHQHVGEQQMNSRGSLARDLQRRSAIRCFEDGVACFLEYVTGSRAHGR